MQLSYRDAQGNIQLIRAGTALPANFAPHREYSNIGTGIGLNANGRVSPFVTHNPPANYNMWISVDLPKPLVPRAVVMTWEVDAPHANAGVHWIGLYCGVWNTTTNTWASPIHVMAHGVRAVPLTGYRHDLLNIANGPTGLGNGQLLNSSWRQQFPIEVHPDLTNLANQSNDYVLRFFMALVNAHPTENITGPWRAWFTLLCF